MRTTKSSQLRYVKKLTERVRKELRLQHMDKKAVYAPSITDAELALLRKNFKSVRRDSLRNSFVWFEI